MERADAPRLHICFVVSYIQKAAVAREEGGPRRVRGEGEVFEGGDRAEGCGYYGARSGWFGFVEG